MNIGKVIISLNLRSSP